MISLDLTVNTSSFHANFLALRNKWEDDIPIDVIAYFCEDCQQNLYMNPNGVFILSDSIEEPFSDFVTKLQTFFMEEHLMNSDICSGRNIYFTNNCGLPKNLIFLLQETEILFLNNFFLDDEEFFLETVIKSKDDVSKAVLVVYKSQNSESEYSDFIQDNFYGHLNVDLDVEDISQNAESLIIDDETANEYRHLLPRMEGGGRELNKHFNYVCNWCPKEKIKGQRGKFYELKNYR